MSTDDIISLPDQPVIAVVGATGVVGNELMNLIEERGIPYSEFHAIASERSRGKDVSLNDEIHEIKTPSDVNWEEVDLALMSAGSDLSRSLTPELESYGVLVVDNSSAFRMDPDTPLVVPEVNWNDDVRASSRVANPNCSATQLVMALKPLQDRFGLNQVFVTTYQSISGAGGAAVDEYQERRKANENEQEAVSGEEFRDPIDENVIPFIPHGSDASVPFGEPTGEEKKVVQETQKILEDPDLRVSVTCARIPVPVSHSEAVHVSLDDNTFSLSDVLGAFESFSGVEVVEDGEQAEYPQPDDAEGTDPVYVGRIREDEALPGGLAFWCVGDNLRKGAALNTIQIAEQFFR